MRLECFLVIGSFVYLFVLPFTVAMQEGKNGGFLHGVSQVFYHNVFCSAELDCLGFVVFYFSRTPGVKYVWSKLA